jgi:hypothetical protein
MDGHNASSYYYLPLKIFACVDVGRCNNGRVGISFVGGGWNNDQWGQQN